MSKKLLITGASGLLGSNLARMFSQEFEVIGVYNRHPVNISDVQAYQCDLADYRATRAMMLDSCPDIVLHCASRTDVDSMEVDREGGWRANVLTTRNVVDSLRDTDVKLIYISTDSVYSGDAGPHSESGGGVPKNWYGETKLMGESLVKDFPDSLILRTNIFGWNIQNKESLSEWFLSRLTAGLPFTGFSDVHFNGIYTMLLGGLIEKCLNAELSGIYNCASRNSMSKFDFGQKLATSLGFDSALIRSGTLAEAGLTADRGLDMSMSMASLESALGESLPTMEDSIEAFANDYREGVSELLRKDMRNVPATRCYPVRDSLGYGCQCIDDDDIQAVVDVLQSKYLTTGPSVTRFERSVADFVGVRHGVAVSNGTAALHAAMFALGVGPGDEVIVPAMTFAATANCVVYQGAKPVFADVAADTLLIDPASVEQRITPATKAIIAVDYAGQPCDWDALHAIAEKHKLVLVADGCHALGASYKGRSVGSIASMTCFSFHPVKHIATGEGGMVTTDNDELAARLRLFRNHGISTDARQREKIDGWFYDMEALGYNYRLTDIQCALGLSQMGKLPRFVERRQEIAAYYDATFSGSLIHPLIKAVDRTHAYHLYVVRVPDRERVFKKMREVGIGVNVHYIPVHFHSYYRNNHGTGAGLCPVAEDAYGDLLSLPVFPGMSDNDMERVSKQLDDILGSAEAESLG